MDQINFNIMQLIVEEIKIGERFVYPTIDTLTDLESSFHLLIDNVYYEVKIEKNNNFIWFVFDYNKPDPIDDQLTNIHSGKKKDNPRKPDEAELTHQLFALYDFNSNRLYFSNLNKEKMFENMLKEKLQKQFIIKKNFKSKEEFISILKEVNEISFTEIKNLFSRDSKKRQALIDLTGTDAPERFTIDAKYSKNTEIGDFLSILMKSKQDSELNDLTIRGTDEDDFEFIFNVDSFIQKLHISCEKEDNGKYDSNKVKTELLNRIK